MKVLITGAAGMLGRDLVDALRPQFDLVGCGIGDGSMLPIAYSEVDLTNQPLVEKFWDQTKPDLVFHLAAVTDVDLCEKKEEQERVALANTRAVEFVARASQRHEAPVVFISTDFVFDGQEVREYSEEDAPNPLSFYGQTKADAEKVLREIGGLYVVFRICWLYGLHGRSFPRAILQAAQKKDQLKVVSDQVGRPTYTRDICAAFKTMLSSDAQIFRKNAGNIFHLANTGTASWADFAAEVLKLSESMNCTVERISWRELDPPRAARRPEHAVLSLEKVRRELGVELRPWQDALKEFIPELQKQLS
ncbi:MAG: dTDP-4-dehydrorhamnose reductase [Candidatus Omnitrophica bacterium]|nr:dTDP-4-dehydrorhamnose reductase [Candidatus Omnitrophota bacterium]